MKKVIAITDEQLDFYERLKPTFDLIKTLSPAKQAIVHKTLLMIAKAFAEMARLDEAERKAQEESRNV